MARLYQLCRLHNSLDHVVPGAEKGTADILQITPYLSKVLLWVQK